MTNSTVPAEATGAPSPGPALFRWEIPDKPVSILTSLDVIDRLEREVLESFKAVTKRGSEIGGLLLGRAVSAGKRTVTIEDYRGVECEYGRGPLFLLSDADKRRLEEALERARAQGLGVVGFFRSNTRRELVLDEDDVALIEQYFAAPEHVVLLVKPFAMKPSAAGFFFREDGKIQSESTYLQFPFRRSELTKVFAQCIISAGPQAAPAERSAPVMLTPRREERPPVPAAPPPPPKPPEAVKEPAAAKREERQAGPVLVAKREEPPVVMREERVPLPAAPPQKEERPPVTLRRDERPAASPPVTPAPPPVAKQERAPAVTLKRDAAPRTEKQDRASAAVPPARPETTPPAAQAPAEPKPAVALAPKPVVEPAAKPQPAPEPAPSATADAPLAAARVETAPGLWSRLAHNRLTWVALIGIVVLVGALALLRVFGGGSEQVQLEDPSLALRVERNAGQLLLSWNRNAGLIQTAQRATLTIGDGEHKEDVDLDLGQLRSGSIVYSPISNDVSFRLEVTDLKQGKSLSESVRVLAGRPSPLVPIIQQAPPPPAMTTTERVVATPPPAPVKPVEQPAPSPVAQPLAATAQPAAAAEPKPSAPVPEPTARPPAPSPQLAALPQRQDSLAARLSAPDPQLLQVPRREASAGASPIETSQAVPPIAAAPPPPVKEAPKPAASQPAPAPAPQATQAKPTRIGGNVQEAKLIRRVTPIYPPLARQARVSGSVKVEATIGRDGKVKNVTAVSGPPLLRQSATDAVQRWVFEPSTLNGEPIESVTTVDVSFSLGR